MGILKLNGIDYMGGGGGGNANEQVLTWAEYCALTEEEKTNGTTYYISDINGDGQSFQPIIYSTEEQEIGVWIDGKPLYQKSFTGTWNISSAWVDTDVIIPDGWAVKAEAVVYENDGNAIQVLSNISPTGHVFLFSLRAGTTYVVNYFTMWYTKTTDQPGSGTWTPQGVPAVHYSTEEQVIGTWYNGKTLYEKVVVFSSPINMTASGVTISEFSTTEIEDVIQCDCFRAHDSQYGSGCSAVLATIYNGNLVLYDANGLSLATGLRIQYTKTSS